MLRVTKLADYGILLMTCFAAGQRTTFSARDLAREARLPMPVVSKVLKLLARAGLLVSQRGVKGGYALARKPEEISVADIIRALEGPIAMTHCSDRTRPGCGLEGLCPVSANWERINRAIHRALEGITLAQMTRPLPPGRVHVDLPVAEGFSVP